MSIMIFIALFTLAKNGVTVAPMDFFAVWALFSIADALWTRNFFKQ